jgi:hypothetical protein
MFGSVLLLSSLFSYVTVRHAAEIRLPFLQDLLRVMNAEETQRSKDFARENLNAMAVKLGEMQAQLLRLDTIGERLAGMAGVKPQELKAFEAKSDGRGGPLVLPEAMSATQLQRAVDALAQQVDAKSDAISMIESQLLEDRIRKSLLPTSLPIDAQWNASAYGWRVDPFTGERALHEGVDFVAPTGTDMSPPPPPESLSAQSAIPNTATSWKSTTATTWPPATPTHRKSSSSRDNWSSAARRSPKWGPPAARPGPICISRSGFAAWRRTPTVSCA